MIEKSKLITIEQADGSTLYKRVILSGPCTIGTDNYLLYFNEILRMIGSNTDIVQCGPVRPESAIISHDGERWVFTFKASYEKKTIQ